MIVVSINPDKDIVMECGGCEFTTTVKWEWAESPFWDVFAGQAILVMLGHMVKSCPRDKPGV